MEEEKVLTLKSLEKETNAKFKKMEEKISLLEKQVKDLSLTLLVVKQSLRSRR